MAAEDSKSHNQCKTSSTSLQNSLRMACKVNASDTSTWRLGGHTTRLCSRDLDTAATGGEPRMLSKCAPTVSFQRLVLSNTQTVEAGTTPDLEGTETPYKFGYITLVMAGAQHIRPMTRPTCPTLTPQVSRHMRRACPPAGHRRIYGSEPLYYARPTYRALLLPPPIRRES